MRGIRCFLFLCALLMTSLGRSESSWQVPLAHSGYLSSVENEKNTISQRLEVVENPQQGPKMDLRDKIFTEKLKKEFRDRYREKFGQTTTEQLISHPSRYTYYRALPLATEERLQSGTFAGDHIERYKENERFGFFMFRRLTEYHVDQYTKDKPVVKQVYEFKEKYSRMSLSFSRRVRLRARYQVSANSVRLKLENPWVENSVLLEMDPGSLGPSEVKETTISANFGLPFSVLFDARYRAVENSLTLAGSRALGPGLSASLSVHWNRRIFPDQAVVESTEKTELPLQEVVEDTRDTLVLTGLSWNY